MNPLIHILGCNDLSVRGLCTVKNLYYSKCVQLPWFRTIICVVWSRPTETPRCRLYPLIYKAQLAWRPQSSTSDLQACQLKVVKIQASTSWLTAPFPGFQGGGGGGGGEGGGVDIGIGGVTLGVGCSVPSASLVRAGGEGEGVWRAPTIFVGVTEQVLKLVVVQLSVKPPWLSLFSSFWLGVLDSVCVQEDIVHCNWLTFLKVFVDAINFPQRLSHSSNVKVYRLYWGGDPAYVCS